MNLTLPLMLVLALLAYGARRMDGSWVTPAPLFAALWAGYMVVAALVFPELDELVTASFYVLAAGLALTVGTLLAVRNPVSTAANTAAILRTAMPGLALMTAAGLGAGMVDLSILFNRFGFSLGDIFSYDAIVSVTVQARAQSYAKASEMGMIEWFCYLLLYFSEVMGGLLFALARSWGEKALAVIGLIAGPVVLGFYGSRMGALFGGAFWVAAYLAATTACAPSLKALDRKAIGGAAATGGLGILGMSIIVQVVRYSTNLQAVGWRAILADVFGFAGALGIWMDERGAVVSGLTAGARSLTKVVGPLGISEPLLTITPVGFTSSNIYTLLRDLIEDFGTLGSLVLLVLLGWLARRAFERAREGDLRGIPLLFGIYTFIFTSFAVGIFFYNATMMAFLMAGAYLIWAGERHRRRTVGWSTSPTELAGLPQVSR